MLLYTHQNNLRFSNCAILKHKGLDNYGLFRIITKTYKNAIISYIARFYLICSTHIDSVILAVDTHLS